MNDASDDTKLAKSQFKTALSIFGGFLLLALVTLAVLIFRDGPPPEDAHLVSNASDNRAANQNNPLAIFEKQLKEHPVSGTNLPPVPPGTIPVDEQNKKLIGLNLTILDHWHQLLDTDIHSWQWPTEPAGSEVELSDYYERLEGGFDDISTLCTANYDLLMAKQQYQEAMDFALKMIRYWKGLQIGQVDQYMFTDALVRQSSSLIKLEKALAATGANSEELKHVQHELALLETSLQDFNQFLRLSYQTLKKALAAQNAQKINDSLASTQMQRGWMQSSMLKRNATLALNADIITQLIALIENEGKVSVDALTLIFNRANLIESPKWMITHHPNTLGHQITLVHLEGLKMHIQIYLSQIARYRLSTINLAIRRFELTHGRLPEKLDELIPKFMESIPIDPVDEQPFRWDYIKQTLFRADLEESMNDKVITRPKRAPTDVGVPYPWSDAIRETRAKSRADKQHAAEG